MDTLKILVELYYLNGSECSAARDNRLSLACAHSESATEADSGTAESEERTCPWCAETIKAAAVICRFCGRDIQAQPSTLRGADLLRQVAA